jgi:pyridoxine 5-phosphate synthase
MTASDHLRLGVNVDHVATLRNARGEEHPDPIRAAQVAVEAGADGITAHLREDRRHIRDQDIARLRAEIDRPLNLEMAATEEMLAIALRHLPNACCLVPERREEVTTEGGLDVAGQVEFLTNYVAALKAAGIRVSLFIDPEEEQVAAAATVGADIVELHTGTYCAASHRRRADAGEQLGRLRHCAAEGERLGLEIHAGHGLDFHTVGPVAAIAQMRELNIGHFLVGEAVFTGFAAAIATMREAMDSARADQPAERARS